MAKAKLTKRVVRKATRLNKDISKFKLREAGSNLGMVNAAKAGKSVAKTKRMVNRADYDVAVAKAGATAAGIKPKKAAKIVNSNAKYTQKKNSK